MSRTLERTSRRFCRISSAPAAPTPRPNASVPRGEIGKNVVGKAARIVLVLPLIAILAACAGENRAVTAGPQADRLPAGTSAAEVRRFCTARYDHEASNFMDPNASGWGGISDAQLLVEFRHCMERHGVRP